MQRNIAKRLSVWAVLVAAMLMIPLLTRAPWTGSDYVFGAVLLFGAASVYEMATRKIDDPSRRLKVGAVVFVVLAFVWVGAATGFEGVFDRLCQAGVLEGKPWCPPNLPQ